MKLVIDSNILFSFFKKESQTRRIITLFDVFEFYTPKSRIDELVNHRKEICRKAKISEKDFDRIVLELRVFIEVVDEKEAAVFFKQAQKLAPHIEDAPLFSLALLLGCGIWSQEKAFKRQEKIIVYRTEDRIRLLAGK
jgi:predicted nucleic acid-binding protein